MAKQMTHDQKLAKGFEYIGKIGNVRQYLTPSELKQIKQGIIADRDKFIAYKMDNLRRRLEGDAKSNAPMKPYIGTNGNNVVIEQTGTRRWAVFSKAKLAELLSPGVQKTLKALLAKLPDLDTAEMVDAEDADEVTNTDEVEA